jgi:hypothetical protein
MGHFTVPSPLPGQDGQNGAAVAQGDEAAPPQVAGLPPDRATVNDGIAGMSALRGLMLYGAILAFAGLYIYFIVVISDSRSGAKPVIDATLISAAAALSGVLGSAFALKIGVAPNPALVNSGLAEHAKAVKRNEASATAALIRRALSLEPSDTNAKSWPLTFGIWAYAVVASAVLAAYILNQNETPDAVKALAVTFAGYVIALINMAYGLTKRVNA